jgi:hypothetical protein
MDANYPVLVVEHNGQYTLRIRELMLIVRGRDLSRAYGEILDKKRRIIAWATTVEALDELPPPQLPVLTATIRC